MGRYTGKEQGGKGVYRNLNNDQFLGFSSDDFAFFKKHLGSHFDISESLNEAIYTDPNTGKSYDLQHDSSKNRWELDIIKKDSSIYDKIVTIKRETVEEIIDWLEGYNIDSSWVKKSLNEGIYDKFLDNPSSPKGRAKSLILKFTKEYGDDASSMAVDRFASKNNLKPEEKYILKYITKNDIKISSQPGGPDFSALNEADDKLLKIKQELEALRPSISWIDDIFISSYDGSLQVELDYTLYPNEIKQLAQIAAKYGMELKYMTGKNATLVKNKINEDKKYNQEELLKLDLIAHRKFDCDYKKCTDEQKAEVLKDKVKVGVKEALQESKKDLDEAEFKGKKVALGKPKRGGPKAYYVYVKDGDKVKKVTFGSGGLRAKIKNKEARNAFAARHNCKDKKDRTKAGYWSCNLPRYAPALGLGAKMNTFW